MTPPIIRPQGRFIGHEVIDKNRKHLEPEEVKRLFGVLHKGGSFFFTYFRLQMYFGLRVSEVAIILKEDVSYKEGLIVVRRLKKKQFKSITTEENGKKIRRTDMTQKIGDGFSENVYSLPDKLTPLLKEVAALSPKENPWLFASPRSPNQKVNAERMANIRRTEGGWRSVSRSLADIRFREAATEAGVPENLRHTHVLRHTRATLMLAQGVKEEDVKHLLGHASIATTRGYLGVARQLRLRMEGSLILGDLDG